MGRPSAGVLGRGPGYLGYGRGASSPRSNGPRPGIPMGGCVMDEGATLCQSLPRDDPSPARQSPDANRGSGRPNGAIAGEGPCSCRGGPLSGALWTNSARICSDKPRMGMSSCHGCARWYGPRCTPPCGTACGAAGSFPSSGKSRSGNAGGRLEPPCGSEPVMMRMLERSPLSPTAPLPAIRRHRRHQEARTLRASTRRVGRVRRTISTASRSCREAPTGVHADL